MEELAEEMRKLYNFSIDDLEFPELKKKKTKKSFKFNKII